MTVEGGTIAIPFAIGETVWHCGYGSRVEWETCPECAGTKILTLVRGNGERVTLACAACSHGFEPPLGLVSRRIFERAPTPFLCAWVEVRGSEVRYMETTTGSGSIVDAEDLFHDADECAARCAEINAQHAREEAQRMTANLESKRRDMAWSVFYWGRKVKGLERDLALAKARLDVCRERKGGDE